MLCQKGRKIMLCTQYRYIYIQCYVKRVKRLSYVNNIDTFNAMLKRLKDYVMLKQGTYTSLLITFLIFNQFSIRKKFWKAETWTFPTKLYYVCQSMLKGLKVVSKSQLSKTLLGLKINWILRKLWVKMLWAVTAYFGGARGHFIQSTLSSLLTWVSWVTLLCI